METKPDTQTKWNNLPSRELIEKIISALKTNGIEAYYFESGDDAKKKVFELLPEGSEVMNMTSATLDELGISKEIEESGKFNSVRKKVSAMNRETQKKEMKTIGIAPEYAIGSVHAVTENGEILVASGSGSQLPAYVYGADNVIFVVGANKIVKNVDEGMKRIYEHSLPLESERVKKVYGMPRSNVNKILIINKETAGRIKLIFVNKTLGF